VHDLSIKPQAQGTVTNQLPKLEPQDGEMLPRNQITSWPALTS